MAGLDGETLRAAARALWEELFGEPLVPIVDDPRHRGLAE